MGGDAMIARWAATHHGDAQRDFSQLPCLRVAVPQQPNSHDCGLFALTYLQFFTAGLPEHIILEQPGVIRQQDLEGVGIPTPHASVCVQICL